jgi:hypothetical protein
MFGEREILNAHFKFQGAVYGAPELEAYEGQTVKVSSNRLYPAAMMVFTMEYHFICLAKNASMWKKITRVTGRQQVMDSIETMILQEEAKEGPSAMRPYSIDEWIGVVENHITDAGRHSSYGNKHHAMDALLKIAKSCVQALEYHIDQEATKAAPALEEAIAQLNLQEHKTADPAGTESAA